jgi:protocatechuate 3,4-dioxygenase beta subunit
MKKATRREFIVNESVGLAALSCLVLTLRADAQPTPGTTHVDAPKPKSDTRAAEGSSLRLPKQAVPTSATGYGPFYTPRAPFRARSSPPFEPGTCLIVTGRVWGYDTKAPLPSVVIDVWHSDIQGNYSTSSEFRNRTRLVTAEEGQYEFEAIHPVAYPVDNGKWWRSPHIHFKVASPGYMSLITELYFEGDKLHEQDKVFQPALMMPVTKRKTGENHYEAVVFDIVLERGKGTKGA